MSQLSSMTDVPSVRDAPLTVLILGGYGTFGSERFTTPRTTALSASIAKIIIASSTFGKLRFTRR